MYKINYNLTPINSEESLMQPTRRSRKTTERSDIVPLYSADDGEAAFFPWTSSEWNPPPSGMVTVSTLDDFLSVQSLSPLYHFFFFFQSSTSNSQNNDNQVDCGYYEAEAKD